MDRREPQLYRRYSRKEILLLAGALGSLEARSNGQWLIGGDIAICLASLHDPSLSHFQSASRFNWVTDKPHDAGGDRDYPFIPVEVRAGMRPVRTIWLFVQRPQWREYLYVGRLDPSNAWGVSPGRGSIDFSLSPAMSSAVWAEIHGAQSTALDNDRLDHVLNRLSASDSETRFMVLRELTEYWHGRISADDGFSAEVLASLTMPEMLRRWYRWAGRRTAILSGQNLLRDPDQLKLEDGLLWFYSENQGCHFWATQPEGDDPPMFSRVDHTVPWTQEGMTLSEHLIFACLFEAIVCHAPYGANGMLERSVIDQIAAVVPPLPIASWQWMQARFHAGGGAYMCVMGGDRGGFIWIGAKTQEPLLFLRSYDIDWDYVAF